MPAQVPEEAQPVRARAGRPRLERVDRARQVRRQLDVAAVGERVAGDRLHPQQLELLGQRRAGLREEVSNTHGIVSSDGPESQVNAVALHPPALAARRVAACSQHRHAWPACASRTPRRGRRRRRRRRRPSSPAHPRSSAGTANAPIAAAPAAATTGRRHSTALANALADPGPHVERERAVVVALGGVAVLEQGQTAKTPSPVANQPAKLRGRHALVAPAAGPPPVAVARHARVQEDVPGGQRARGERRPARRAGGPAARRPPRRAAPSSPTPRRPAAARRRPAARACPCSGSGRTAGRSRPRPARPANPSLPAASTGHDAAPQPARLAPPRRATWRASGRRCRALRPRAGARGR